MFSQAVVNKGRDGRKEGRKRHLSTVTTNNLLSVWVTNISDVIYIRLQHMRCRLHCLCAQRNCKIDFSSFQRDFFIYLCTNWAYFCSFQWQEMLILDIVTELNLSLKTQNKTKKNLKLSHHMDYNVNPERLAQERSLCQSVNIKKSPPRSAATFPESIIWRVKGSPHRKLNFLLICTTISGAISLVDIIWQTLYHKILHKNNPEVPSCPFRDSVVLFSGC